MLATSPPNMPNIEHFPDFLRLERSKIVFVHRLLMPILSKKDLQEHFQLTTLRALRRKVLTDEILTEAGITAAEYQGKWYFTAAQSARLYAVLNITWLRTNQKI